MRGLALVNLAGYVVFDDVTAAIRHARDAVTTARELGEAYVAAFAQSNLANALLHSGDWEEATRLATTGEIRSFLGVSIDIQQRLMAMAQGELWPTMAEAVGQDPASMEDQAWLLEYDLDRALEAHVLGFAEASGLALDCVRRADEISASIDEFYQTWLHAAEIVRADPDPESIALLLTYVDPDKGPWPRSVRAQRSRLQAVLGAAGSLAPESVEELFRSALTTAHEWGSALYVAHTSADFGVWLLGQGRDGEGAALVADAREFYERVGARRWLEKLADGGPGAS